MLTIDEAFRKFKSRLELNDKEQVNASARQQEVRDYLDTKFKIDRSFLTGSYKRWTKTKPLKDVDIFFVLQTSEDHYRSKAPSVVLTDFHDVLVEKYGDKAKKQNRSINVDFGVKADADDNTDYRVISVDVVPAFDNDDDFAIPDNELGKWIETNPQVHAEKATAAHQAYSNEWKGLVRMVKYWNNNPKHGDKPIKPSFLIEVMMQELVDAPFTTYPSEVRRFFAASLTGIGQTWGDPAGYGPPVSDQMTPQLISAAQEKLREAETKAALAVRYEQQGRQGDAIALWREIMGKYFPAS